MWGMPHVLDQIGQRAEHMTAAASELQSVYHRFFFFEN